MQLLPSEQLESPRLRDARRSKPISQHLVAVSTAGATLAKGRHRAAQMKGLGRQAHCEPRKSSRQET